MSKKIEFPENFLWGTATSAYQVEGGIDNSDWSKKFPAGEAIDHYNKYEQDFDLMEELNQNAYRFSIEWSRIEPEEGIFDDKEIEHYRKLIESLKGRGIKTMVTLHHFTSPAWFSRKGGWANPKSSSYFLRFAERMFKEYGVSVDFWITVNEPLIYCSKSFLEGSWPPFRKNFFVFKKALNNQISAHKKVFEKFHRIDGKVKIGIAKNNQFFEPANKKSILDKLIVLGADYFWNELFLNKIKNHLDFIGLNYYFHNKIKFPYKSKNENEKVSDLGWEIYPHGIYHILMDLRDYDVPIYVTENGLADEKDEYRQEFIKDHLTWISKAIKEGIEIKGYFHWSLLDNFEWDKGFEPRFGLIKVDYKDLSRSIRLSARYYAEVCRNNYING